MHIPLPLLPPSTPPHSLKFCRYFDVEERYVPAEVGRYVATPELIRDLCDENTIGARYRTAFVHLQSKVGSRVGAEDRGGEASG
jgi:hypothetical protein